MAKIKGTTFDDSKKYSDLKSSIALLEKKKGTSPEIDAELKRRKAAVKKFEALYAAAVEKGYTQSLDSSTYKNLMKYVNNNNPSAKAGLDAYDASVDGDKPKEPLTPAEKRARGLGIAAGAVGAWAALGAIVGAFGGGDLTVWFATQAIPAIGSAIGTVASAMFSLSPTFAIGSLLAVGLAAPLIVKGVKKLWQKGKEKRLLNKQMKQIDKENEQNQKVFNSLMANVGALSEEEIKSMTILTTAQKTALIEARNKKDDEGKSKADRHKEKGQIASKQKGMAAEYEKYGGFEGQAGTAVRAHKQATDLKTFGEFIELHKDLILSNEDKDNYKKAETTKADAEQKNADGNFLGETDIDKTKIDIAKAKVTELNEFNTGKDFLGETDDTKKKIDIAKAKAEEAARVESGKTKTNLELAEIDLAAKQEDEARKKEDYEHATLSSEDRKTKRGIYLTAKHEREKAEQKVKLYKDAQTYVTDYTKANEYISDYNAAVSTVNDEKYKKNYVNTTQITFNGSTQTLYEHLLEGKPDGLTQEQYRVQLLTAAKEAGFSREEIAKLGAFIDSFSSEKFNGAILDVEQGASNEIGDYGERTVSIGSKKEDADKLSKDYATERDDALAICGSKMLEDPEVLAELGKLSVEEIKRLAAEHAAESSMGG